MNYENTLHLNILNCFQKFQSVTDVLKYLPSISYYFLIYQSYTSQQQYINQPPPIPSSMSIKRTTSQIVHENQKNQQVHSQTILTSKHNLKELIKQTTIKDSKPDMKKSQHPLSMLRRAITQSIKKTTEVVCHICQIKYQQKQVSKICSCPHLFCKTCIQSYLNYKINAFEPIHCPEEKCEGAFSKESEIFLELPIQMRGKYQKNLRFIQANKNPSLKQCHQPNCEGYFDTSTEPCFCEVCKTEYCPKCNFKGHTGECQDFHVQFLQNNYKFRQCNSCKNMIEKNEGCNHISCRCGYNFCYLCGADWAIDPCRYGGNPPPPPPPPREPRCCFVTFLIIFSKILFSIVYSSVAIPLWLAGCLLIIGASMAVSAVIGGMMLFIDSVRGMDCVSIFFLSIFIPVILVGGIFWYFFDNIDVTCEFLSGFSAGMIFPLTYVCEACD